MNFWHKPSGAAPSPQVWGMIPNKTALVSDARHILGVPRPPVLLTNWLQSRGALTTPSASIIHWNDSQNSGKCYAYYYSFTLNDTNQDQSVKRHVGWGPDTELWRPLPVEPGCTMVPAQPPGGSPKPQHSEFLLGFHYLAWLIALLTWLNSISIPPSLPGVRRLGWLISRGSKLKSSDHMVGLSSKTSSHLSHLLSINSGIVQCSLGITKTQTSLGNFQWFRGSIPGTQDKDQTSSLLYDF